MSCFSLPSQKLDYKWNTRRKSNFQQRNLSKQSSGRYSEINSLLENPRLEVWVNKSIKIQKCFPSSSCTVLCVMAHLWRNVPNQLLETPTCEGFSSNHSSGGVWMFTGAMKAGNSVAAISPEHDLLSVSLLMRIISAGAWGDTTATANETWAWGLVWFF